MKKPPPSGELAHELPARFPHLEALRAADGHFLIGSMPPVPHLAIAADDTRMYATLVPQAGERIDGLLKRLNEAVGEAMVTGKPVNEMQGAELRVRHPKGRGKR